jgi:hypothetical protein
MHVGIEAGAATFHLHAPQTNHHRAMHSPNAQCSVASSKTPLSSECKNEVLSCRLAREVQGVRVIKLIKL